VSGSGSPRATHVAVADSLNDPLLTNSTTAAAAPASAASTSSTASSSAGATTTPPPVTPRTPKKTQSEQITETVQLVKDYALQETLAPVKNAGKWIGFGLLGAVLIGLATAFLSLGLLRMVQSEWPDTFDGRWMSLLPYLFALLLCILVAALAFSRINKQPLTKEKR
jgi:cobalamin biosynthesis Mg chelatase CobN